MACHEPTFVNMAELQHGAALLCSAVDLAIGQRVGLVAHAQPSAGSAAATKPRRVLGRLRKSGRVQLFDRPKTLVQYSEGAPLLIGGSWNALLCPENMAALGQAWQALTKGRKAELTPTISINDVVKPTYQPPEPSAEDEELSDSPGDEAPLSRPPRGQDGKTQVKSLPRRSLALIEPRAQGCISQQ